MNRSGQLLFCSKPILFDPTLGLFFFASLPAFNLIIFACQQQREEDCKFQDSQSRLTRCQIPFSSFRSELYRSFSSRNEQFDEQVDSHLSRSLSYDATISASSNLNSTSNDRARSADYGNRPFSSKHSVDYSAGDKESSDLFNNNLDSHGSKGRLLPTNPLNWIHDSNKLAAFITNRRLILRIIAGTIIIFTVVVLLNTRQSNPWPRDRSTILTAKRRVRRFDSSFSPLAVTNFTGTDIMPHSYCDTPRL